jgi:NADH-quinone oxidoreductase subunit G
LLRQTAQVLLPIGLLPEIDATLTNLDGIEQQVRAGAKLPGEARPGWRVLRALGEALGMPEFDSVDLEDVRRRNQSSGAGVPASSTGLASRPAGQEGLIRIATKAIYRSDAVVRRAAPLNAHPLTRGAAITLNPQDAAGLELMEGQIARIDDGRGLAALPVRISDRVAAGAAWIESGYPATAPIAGTGARLSLEKV